jgi:CDP-diacylglycerol--serine O-phosphatidyltransferase
VILLAMAASTGRIGPQVRPGPLQSGPRRLHPLMLAFAPSGWLMIGRILRIPKS